MEPAQKLTLRAHILANATVLPFAAGNATVSAKFQASPLDAGDAALIAAWYNGPASPDFYVWQDLPMETVQGLVTLASLTPLDAVPAVTSLPASPTAAQNATYNNQMAALHIWSARNGVCQTKGIALQNLTVGRGTAPMKLTGYRAAMQDCLTNIPAGASGAVITANWVGVRDAAKRKVNNFEKVFATGTGSLATPADAGLDGVVTGNAISDIKGLPA